MDSDGTIHYVHEHIVKGVTIEAMNLLHPRDYYDPQGRIKSIYISVFNPSDLRTPIGFAIDSLTLQEIPEPAMPLMIGGGLAALALYRRKRRSRVG